MTETFEHYLNLSRTMNSVLARLDQPPSSMGRYEACAVELKSERISDPELLRDNWRSSVAGRLWQGYIQWEDEPCIVGLAVPAIVAGKDPAMIRSSELFTSSNGGVIALRLQQVTQGWLLVTVSKQVATDSLPGGWRFALIDRLVQRSSVPSVQTWEYQRIWQPAAADTEQPGAMQQVGYFLAGLVAN